MSKAKIAIVDNKDMTRISLSMLLEKRLKVDVAINVSSGNELLAHLKRYEVDLLITDLMMPTMSGEELCKEVRKNYPNIKVVVISAYEDQSTVENLTSIGVKAFLRKDMKLDLLVGAIEDILNEEKSVFS